MADSLEYEVLPADLPAEARARMTSGMALATVVATDERHAGRGFAIRYVFEGVGVGGF